MFRQMSLMILGSSHAARLRRRLRERGSEFPGISAAGIPGGRLLNQRHHRRLLTEAKVQRPEQVLLVIGGNDLCGRDLDFPFLSESLTALGLGLLALGVRRVWALPILPRMVARPGDVSAPRFEQRRLAVNRIWATRFRRPPVTLVGVDIPRDILGRDGVHMSARGEVVMLQIAQDLLL